MVYYYIAERQEDGGFKLWEADGRPNRMTESEALEAYKVAVSQVGTHNVMLLRTVPVLVEVTVEVKK